MEKKKCISSDMEPFLDGVAALFAESTNKGPSTRDSFKAMSIPFSNFLLDCSNMSVNKARSMTHLKLPNGAYPKTALPRPPAWLKTNSKDQAQLQKASNPCNFLKKLRSLLEKQSAQPDGSKRKAGDKYQAPAKKARTSTSKKPKHALKEEPQVKAEPISGEAVPWSCDVIPTIGGCASSLEQVQCHPPCAHQLTFAERAQEAALEAMKGLDLENSSTTPVNERRDSDTPQDSTMSTIHDHSKNNADIADLELKGEPGTGSSSLATPNDIEDHFGHEISPKDAIFDKITAHHIGQVFASSGTHGDDDTHSEGESQVSCASSEDKIIDQQQDTFEAKSVPGTEDILNGTIDAIEGIQSVDAADWEAFRPEFVNKVCTLRLASTDTGSEHDSELLDALSRFFRALVFVKEQAVQVPPKAWMKYQKKLAGFCSRPETKEMSLTKRLAKFGSWIYLSEEIAVTTGDWARVENAVYLSAKLAEVTGKEDEDFQQDETKEWCLHKLKTLESLKGILHTSEQGHENDGDQEV